MLYPNKMSVAYINYHRQPSVDFMSIKQYNTKFNTSLSTNKVFESNFQRAWKRARIETDSNDYIQHQFDIEEMGWFSDKLAAAKKGYKSVKKKVKRKIRDKTLTKEQKNKVKVDDDEEDKKEREAEEAAKAKKAKEKQDKLDHEAFEQSKKDKATAAAKAAAEAKAKAAAEAKAKADAEEEAEFQEFLKKKDEKLKKKNKLQRKDAVSEDVEDNDDKGEGIAIPNISDFLDDYDEDEEDKYEEVEDVPTLHEQIDTFIAEQAKDSESFKRDKSHVIHFNIDSKHISGQLMKGRDRYLKRLKAYLKGDKSAKVRMMNNKEILVSKLNPCNQSLKDLLKSKSGEPRFVSCHENCEC